MQAFNSEIKATTEVSHEQYRAEMKSNSLGKASYQRMTQRPSLN